MNDNTIKYSIGQTWDKQLSEWINTQKIIYQYDLKGNVTEIIKQYWNGLDWSNEEKITQPLIYKATIQVV